MTEQNFLVIAWQPHVGEWRVFRVWQRRKAERMRQLEQSTKSDAKEAIKSFIENKGKSTNNLGYLPMTQKGGSREFRTVLGINQAVWLERLRGRGKVWNREALVVLKRPGRWEVMTSGPSAGSNPPIRRHVDEAQLKSDAIKTAERHMRKKPFIGIVVLHDDGRGAEVTGNRMLFQDIAEKRLKEAYFITA